MDNNHNDSRNSFFISKVIKSKILEAAIEVVYFFAGRSVRQIGAGDRAATGETPWIG